MVIRKLKSSPDQPRAVLRAFNGTRGRATGAKPYAFSLLGSTSKNIGEKGLIASRDGTTEEGLTLFVLTLISCRTGVAKAFGTSSTLLEGRV